jgi:hypothetical protein
MSRFKTRWSRVLSSGAVFFGLGPFFAADARGISQADAGPTGTGPQRTSTSEVLVRTVGEKVYWSGDGRSFQELQLGRTPEADHLLKLLARWGSSERPISVPVGSIVVANGGGAGPGDKPPQGKAEPSSGKQSVGTAATEQSSATSQKTSAEQSGDVAQKPK